MAAAASTILSIPGCEHGTASPSTSAGIVLAAFYSVLIEGIFLACEE
jgi:hypothetical protein